MSRLTNEQKQRAWQLGQLITDHVRAKGHDMPGSQVATVLRGHDSTFLSESGIKLSDLLDGYAPELTVTGRAGWDLVWGFGLPEDAPDVDALDVDKPGEEGGAVQAEWRSIEFRNYRSLRSAGLELGDLTVLVGRNGAGKSNILDGLFRASLLTRRKPDVVFSDANAPGRVVGRWAPNEGFGLVVHATNGWGFSYQRRDLSNAPDDTPFDVSTGSGGRRARSSLLFTPMGKVFGGATYLHLDARQLAQPTWTPREQPFLRHDGLYLPSVLAHLVQTERERFDGIIEQTRALVPAVQDIRTPWIELERGEGRTMGNRLEVKMRGVGWIPADQLSEGTLLTLGLFTILSRSTPPRLLIVDDIDRGLHPAAQRRLVELLQSIAGGDAKIVCTSHSPYVLDPLAPEDVRIVVSDAGSGETSIHPLTQHPEWGRWSATMTPADFWQYAGDERWPAASLDG